MKKIFLSILTGLYACLAFAQTMQVHHTDGTLTSINTNVIDSVDFVTTAEDNAGSERIFLVPYTTIHPVIQGEVIEAKINRNPVEIRLSNVADRLFYYKGEDGVSHYCQAGDLFDPTDHTIHINIPHDYILGWDTSANDYFLEKSDAFFARKAHLNDYIPLYYNWTSGGYGALYDYVNETLQNRAIKSAQEKLSEIVQSNPGLSDSSEADINPSNRIHNCNRCGYTLTGAPFQSIYSFIEAYREGFDMILCDLRFTNDGVPVLEHDDYLNQYYPGVTRSDGTPLPDTSIEGERIYISQTSYDDLLQYNFSRGSSRYPNVQICTLSDFLSVVKQLGMSGIIELKTPITSEETRQVCRMVKQYGLTDRIWWAGDNAEQLQHFNTHLPQCNLLLATPYFEYYFSGFLGLKTEQNHLAVRFPFNGTDQLNHEPSLDEYIDTLVDNDILLQIGTVNNTEVLEQWFEKGPYANYLWCVRSDRIIASKYLRERILNLLESAR